MGNWNYDDERFIDEQELFEAAKRKTAGKPKRRVAPPKRKPAPRVVETSYTPVVEKESKMSTVDKVVNEGSEFVDDSVDGAKMGLPAAAATMVHRKMVELLKSKNLYPEMLSVVPGWNLLEPWLAVGLFRLVLSVAPDSMQDSKLYRTAKYIGSQATRKKAADIVEALGIEVFAVIEDVVKSISPFMKDAE